MIRNVITVCDGAGLTGGTEKVAITSALGLAKRGIRSIFFAGEGDLFPGFESAGVEALTLGLSDAYHTESKRELFARFMWNKSAGERFSELLKEADLDPNETVIHFHGFRRVLSGSVVEAAKQSKMKLVFTLHDFGLACPNTTFYTRPKSQICTLTPLSAACHLSQCTHSGLPMKLIR